MTAPSVPAPTQFDARTVRALKGAPLSCLILILNAGRPVTNDWLCQFSGYTDKPVSQAVKLLSSPEYNFIRRDELGWVTTGETLMIFGVVSSRNFSDPITTTIKDSINLSTEDKEKESRNFSDSDKQEVWAELYKASIFRNNRTIELVRRDYMTADYVRSHRLAMKEQKKGGPQWASVLIKILEEQSPVPELEPANDGNKYAGGAYADFVQH